jgi:hypothetical protein
MSAGSITRLLAQSGEIILRWSDTPFAPARESLVELVDSDDAEPLVRAPFRIGEDTPVTLVAKSYTVNGIVRFCRADKQSYLITVSTYGISEQQSEAAHFRDPGALAVDDFLTEEEEAKLLESLQDSFRSQVRNSVVPTTFLLRALTQLWDHAAAFAIPSPARLGYSGC